MSLQHTAAGLVLALAAALAAAQTPNPYAGQQHRPIKALSEQEVADLLAGKGMGHAKPAELNGYPGPAHVLELAQALALSESQRQASAKLMADHQARARALGAALVEAERALDQAFAERRMDAGTLQRLVSESGERLAALRAEHLRTHLEQTALLQPQQIALYRQLRGYAPHAH